MEDSHLNSTNFNYSEDTRLDLEFRQILCVIKQFITYVNSAHHLSLYRSWLEKLSASNCNKSNRNRYLIELAKQIKGNVLTHPFDQQPTLGSLEEFPEIETESLQKSEPQGVIAVHTERRVPPAVEEERQCPVQCYIRNVPPVCLPQGKPVSYYQIIDSNDNYVYYPYQEDNKTNQNILPTEGLQKEDDSSWCDLTDTSASSLHPAGAAGDAKEKYFYHKSKMEPVNCDENKNSHVEEESNKKLPLKETKFIPSDWKKTIESLQLRLTETLSQNNELKILIESLNNKLAYELKSKEQLEAKLKVSEIYDKEIEAAKNTTDDQLMALQKAYQNEIQNHFEKSELKMEEIKASYEMKISKIKLEYETDKREKEKEINRLSDIIQQQCISMANEINALRKEVETCLAAKNDDKINVLQKCISKMDRLFHRSEKEYLKQIEKLKQDLELKEKVQQIQMITQRAEIAARTSAEKQKQVDEVMNNLEVKYIKMLEFHEKQVFDGKKQDEERIEYLSDLLKKNNIPFKVF